MLSSDLAPSRWLVVLPNVLILRLCRWLDNHFGHNVLDSDVHCWCLFNLSDTEMAQRVIGTNLARTTRHTYTNMSCHSAPVCIWLPETYSRLKQYFEYEWWHWSVSQERQLCVYVSSIFFTCLYLHDPTTLGRACMVWGLCYHHKGFPYYSILHLYWLLYLTLYLDMLCIRVCMCVRVLYNERVCREFFTPTY